jgi:hypothetical protein
VSQAAYDLDQDDRPAKEQIKEKAREAAENVQGAAHAASDRVGDRLTRLVEERSTQSGEQAIKFAESIRQSSSSMREQGQDGPARLAEQAADRVQAVGLYLRDNDGDRILGDMEDFARRQPLVVAAGGFVLGLAGARFLKASAARRQHQELPAPRPAFEQIPEPVAPTAEMGIGTAGSTTDVAPPPPIDPVLEDPAAFPSTTGVGRPNLPPTTATP